MKVKCLCITEPEILKEKAQDVYWIKDYKCNKCNYNVFFLAENYKEKEFISKFHNRL